MADEEIGLKAVMDVKDFDKGVKAYIKGLDDAEDETKTSGKKIQSSLKKLTSQLNKTSKGFTKALGKGALGAA